MSCGSYDSLWPSLGHAPSLGRHVLRRPDPGPAPQRPGGNETNVPSGGLVLQRAKVNPKLHSPDQVFYSMQGGFHAKFDVHKRSRTAFGSFGPKRSRQGPHTSPHVLNRLLMARIAKDLSGAKSYWDQHEILDKLKYTRLVPRPAQQLHTAGRVVPPAAFLKHGDKFHARNKKLYAQFEDNSLHPEDRLKVLGQYLEHNVLQTYKHGKTPSQKEMAGKGERLNKAHQWVAKEQVDEALDPNTITSIKQASSDPKRDAAKVRKRVRQLLRRTANKRNNQDVLSDDSDESDED